VHKLKPLSKTPPKPDFQPSSAVHSLITDMLKFAIQYPMAIDTITAEHSMKLCDYKLGKEEWKVAKELHEALKVHYSTFVIKCANIWNRSSRMQPLSSPRSSHLNTLPQNL